MLYLKAFRAIWSNKRSYIACIFLIAIGIMMFISMNVASDGLSLAAEKLYRENNLSDVFAKVDAMPISSADSFIYIDGIDEVYARYVVEARVEVPGSDEIITLRIISVTEDMPLNRLTVEGSPIAGANDILVNTTFFNAHGMTAGNPISIFVDGIEYGYYVNGTAMSPEYAYITRGGTDMLPDETGFGIGYISADSMGLLTNNSGVANDVVFGLSPGYVFDDVKIQLEDALAPYGLNELIDKKDQLSYSFMDLEINSIKSMAGALPMVFVLMATAVLYLMMKRVIEQDRTQIGTLKALGYSGTQIMLHYLSYGGVTGFLGGALGFLGGYAMSGFYLQMFLQFFLLPDLTNDISLFYIAAAFVIALGGGTIGAFLGTRKALELAPAEAMRPENPKPIKFDVVNRIKIFPYILTSRGSMAVRSLTRNWMRSSFVVIGVTFSFGLLAISGSMDSLIDKMIMAQFTEIQVYNVKVNLIRPMQYEAAVEDAYAIDYVTRAEGMLEIPVSLKNKHVSEGILLTGIERDSVLYKVTDTNLGISYPPPEGSLILTSILADDLGAAAGDIITISSPLLKDDIPIAVSRVVEQNLGGGAFMEIGALSEMFGMPKTATSVILNTDDLAYLREYLKSAQNAASIQDKETTLQKYRDMMGMYESMYLILQIMCAAVAFAIIYNTATISLSERKREYATLRVLGMSVKEVCEIMNFEYWILSVIAMILGVPFALLLNDSVNNMMDTSAYSMPSSLPMNAYIVGVIGCAAAVMLSNYSAKRRISKFDMIEVLKERE